MGAVKDFAEPVRTSIVSLENEIKDLEKKLEGVDEIYAQMRTKKKQIALLQKTIAQLEGGGPVALGANRPRGQNLKDIEDFLTNASGSHTVREISEATGINIPSVRFTLARNEIFVKGDGHTWTIQD